ncbi:hypothetical protein BDV40DRAFT_267098 [Aspergillus tamarii]|uniref:Uncharacterized protein n=1 Tax=Aspergillus tamarii TaxID=41984 RepID=A0A5N6USV8_ASPTM|nr:hypothetical protein BDV40DRAFT_267098 [Aspergillus tamarii]
MLLLVLDLVLRPSPPRFASASLPTPLLPPDQVESAGHEPIVVRSPASRQGGSISDWSTLRISSWEISSRV